jgi:flagellar FliJ protein
VAFKFRLQKLLEYREEEKKMAQEELARRQRELLEIEAELEKLRREELRTLELRRAEQSKKLDIFTLTAIESYHLFLQERLRSKQQELLQSREQVEEQRQAVVESWKKCEMLERLKEKRREGYLQEEKSREQRLNDEISLYTYFRKEGGLRGKEAAKGC